MENKFICREDGKIKILGVELYFLWLIGIIFAFVGFVGENIFKAVDDGYIDSRFHILPFIGCYALVPFAIHISLGDANSIRLFGWKIFKKDTIWTKIASNILCFLIICTFVFLGELAVGNMWEYFFGVQLWNYSNMFLSFTQYTCLFATLLYGSLAYLGFALVFRPLVKLFQKKVPYKVAKWICLTLGSLLIIDEIRLIITIMVTHTCPHFWKITFFTK